MSWNFTLMLTDRCTNLGGKKILPIVLPTIVKAESFTDHPHTEIQTVIHHILQGNMDIKSEMQEQGFKHFIRNIEFQYH
jgi:hypothetical protein